MGASRAPGMAKLAEQRWQRWQRWLAGTGPIRKAGIAKMWRTQIDVDGDGKEETLIRLAPNGNALETEPPYNCDYRVGALHMAEGADQIMMDSFNGSGTVDIIKFTDDKRAFLMEWTTPGGYPTIEHEVGGTHVVILSTIGRNIGGAQCRIDWVPAKKQRATQPKSITK